MQTNLFDDLKSIKEKITHQEKITKEKVVDVPKTTAVKFKVGKKLKDAVAK